MHLSLVRGGRMASNKDLNKANKAKKDEFYTMLADIEVELKHYRKHFKGKTVLCNCDDPFESNFFKYFAMNFNYLGLKKLIATCYQGSPVLGEEFEQLSMFELDGETPKRHPYKIEITEVVDSNGDGAVDLTDVEYLLRNKKNALTLLTGDGDFRSDECVEILKEADIVVTNPPFSLFREFVAQLVEHGKQFLIIGNVNAITYKEIFPLVKDNKLWMGYSIHSGDREFRVPDDYPLEAAGYRIDGQGRKYIRVKGVRWYTNMDYIERHTDLDLWRTYSEDAYHSLITTVPLKSEQQRISRKIIPELWAFPSHSLTNTILISLKSLAVRKVKGKDSPVAFGLKKARWRNLLSTVRESINEFL